MGIRDSWDDVGRISLTPRAIADEHAACLRRYAEVMFDPFCGLGGDAIAAAAAGPRVFAAEVTPARLSPASLPAVLGGGVRATRRGAEYAPQILGSAARRMRRGHRARARASFRHHGAPSQYQ